MNASYLKTISQLYSGASEILYFTIEIHNHSNRLRFFAAAVQKLGNLLQANRKEDGVIHAKPTLQTPQKWFNLQICEYCVLNIFIWWIINF